MNAKLRKEVVNNMAVNMLLLEGKEPVKNDRRRYPKS